MQITIVEKQTAVLSSHARSVVEQKLAECLDVVQQPNSSAHVEIEKPSHGGYTVRITVKATGNSWHANATRSSTTEAVDESIKTLKEVIVQKRNKSRIIAKRAGDMMKKMMRFGRG